MRAPIRTTFLTTLASWSVVLVAALALSGCSKGTDSEQAPASAPAASAPPTQIAPAAAAVPNTASPDADVATIDEPLPPLAFETALPESIHAELGKVFTGDLDEMVKRRLVRVGVTFSRTHYFIDEGVQRGAAYEYAKLMEDELNKRRNTGNLKVVFWMVPLPRDQLLPALVAGKVDIVIAGLTDTPERRKLVDFTQPTRKDVKEIVVTGPGAPAIASVEDLSGQDVYVRKSSTYYTSLLALNERLKTAGKAPVAIQAAPENLEDDDLLEMANAGLIRITVIDDYLARFWSKVFDKLVLHDTVALRTGGNLAVAIRKNSPQVAAGLNAVIDKYGLGTAFGNMMQKRYLQNTGFVKDATSEAERRKFLALVDLFKQYSEQYSVDYLLMAAQGFQESGLDQSVKSKVGAVGVMQVMPSTAKDLAVGDVRQLGPNINAGVKYMRWMMDRYYKDEPMDPLNKGLFTFASYNAGPARIRQLRKEAETRGLDPNVWFGNVEQIASERIGRETVTYVSNIYKYYVAYRLVAAGNERREAAKQALGHTAGERPAQ